MAGQFWQDSGGIHGQTSQPLFGSDDVTAHNRWNNSELDRQQQFVNGLTNAGMGGMGMQQMLANQLQQQSMGAGPNPAQAQLALNTGQNTQNQAALMAGQRGSGGNAGLLARQAAMAGAQNQQQSAGQAAVLGAQQQLAAQQQLGGLTGQQIGAANQGNAQHMANMQNAQALAQNAYLGQGAQTVAMQGNLNQANSPIAQQNNQNWWDVGKGIAGAIGGAGMLAGMANGGVVPGYADGGQVGSQALSFLVDPNAYLNIGSGPIQTISTNPEANKQMSEGVQDTMSGLLNKKGTATAQTGTAQGLSASSISGGAGAGASGVGGALGAEALIPMAVSKGGKVGGSARVPGDSTANDTVAAKLSPGEVVIPRSAVGSEEKIAKFLNSLLGTGLRAKGSK